MYLEGNQQIFPRPMIFESSIDSQTSESLWFGYDQALDAFSCMSSQHPVLLLQKKLYKEFVNKLTSLAHLETLFSRR